MENLTVSPSIIVRDCLTLCEIGCYPDQVDCRPFERPANLPRAEAFLEILIFFIDCRTWMPLVRLLMRKIPVAGRGFALTPCDLKENDD
jgi:hypothetical protein